MHIHAKKEKSYTNKPNKNFTKEVSNSNISNGLYAVTLYETSIAVSYTVVILDFRNIKSCKTSVSITNWQKNIYTFSLTFELLDGEIKNTDTTGYMISTSGDISIISTSQFNIFRIVKLN